MDLLYPLLPETNLAIEKNPAVTYLASLKPSGRRSQTIALNTIASWFDSQTDTKNNAFTFAWHRLEYGHTSLIATRLAELYKPAGCNRMLSALRGVIRECWKLGLMETDQYTKAVSIKNVKGKTLPTGRALQNRELHSLMKTCAEDKTAAGKRDLAIISVLYGAGVRRNELISLDLKDLSFEDGSLKVLQGKGSKERMVYLAGGAADYLASWIVERGHQSGALFNPIQKDGKILYRRITANAVLKMLRKRAVEAGVEKFTPHDFRRTFISDLLDAGVDLATTSELAGHSNVNTTARYDRRGEQSKRRAAAKLQMPKVK